MKLSVTLPRANRRRESEVGSLIDLQSYRAERDRESVDLNSNTVCSRRKKVHDPSLAALQQNEHLLCVSDRIDEHEQFPFEGCSGILDQMLESISKGDSVLVIGEPGIGKRTLSLGLARKLAALRATTNSSTSVYQRDLYTLSLGASFWSRPPGEDVTDIQENIGEVFRLVEAAGPEKIILCIDDIDILGFVDNLVKEQLRSDTQLSSESVREEGPSDPITSVENMLRTLLFNKKVTCVCTCIKAAYERMIETDTFYDEKFTKSFRVIHMKEPDIEASLRIVRAHRKRIEKEYGIVILDEALTAAVSYANRYITHRVMPDKVLELVHESCQVAIRSRDSRGDEAGPGQNSRNLRIRFRRTRSSRTESTAVLRKEYVDVLVRKWCGFSEEQLQAALQRDALNDQDDLAES